jgi:NAD+ synthase (glutamine-hydrolysing)
MKIALAQLNFHIGNFRDNVAKIRESIVNARQQGARLIIFPELSVSGYPPRDFLEFDDFIDKCLDAVREIAAECHGISAIVGGPSRNPGLSGKRLYNSAFYLEEGEIREVRHKSLLPTYDIFDEYRYFEPNKEFHILECDGKRIALTICEDLWMEGTYPLYTTNPMDELAAQNPALIINIAASPFHYGQAEERMSVITANAVKYKLPVVYVNHVGAQTELIFDGGSMVIDAEGKAVLPPAFFTEGIFYVNTESSGIEAPPGIVHTAPGKIGKIHDALVLGIRDYFSKLGFKKAILGLSGGIDSAVVLALAARALGPDNVKGVLLPSAFSSGHSIDDAIEISKRLGTPYEIIPIEEVYNSFLLSLRGQFEGLPFGLAEENIQARARAVILMALSNKFGYILLNTSNKSEAAVGYGTLYGDMCGGLSVLGDVYKTEVYELAAFINSDAELIPENIITKAPSAELRPGQKDSDSLPEYDILDPLLYQYIEKRRGPDELVAMGFEKTLVSRVLKMVNTNEYKRYQTPPILRVSPKAFGMGRRMPIVGQYLS